MKKISSLIILIFLSLHLWGQSNGLTETKIDSVKYQIGTDLSPLYRNLLKPSSSSNFIFNAPYVLTFKRMKNNRAFRFGVGADIKREISDENQPDTIIQNSIRLRVGFEKQKKVSKRWQINTGVDLSYFSSKREDSNNNVFNSNAKTYGVSPLLGFQFQLTQHLFLQTEASFNLYYQTSNLESNFDIISPNPFPVFSGRELNIFGGNITIPNALLLVVEF